VPEDIVSKVREGAREVTLRLAGGTLKTAQTAEVEIEVEEYKGKQTCALLPVDSFDNKVLFLSPLTRLYSFQLYCELNDRIMDKK